MSDLIKQNKNAYNGALVSLIALWVARNIEATPEERKEAVLYVLEVAEHVNKGTKNLPKEYRDRVCEKNKMLVMESSPDGSGNIRFEEIVSC